MKTPFEQIEDTMGIIQNIESIGIMVKLYEDLEEHRDLAHEEGDEILEKVYQAYLDYLQIHESLITFHHAYSNGYKKGYEDGRKQK